ncbi:DUF2855 family protein [Actinophytocola sediminis]
MSSATGWDLLVRRDDLSTTEVRPSSPDPLAPGEVRLAVERFGISALTATYARFGESPLQFMNVFAAPDGLGRVPVWGFARVEESRAEQVPVGSRYFGWLPMSTHHTVTPEAVDGGFVDATPGRGFAHDWYRTFELAPPDELDDRRALIHPLFPASFNLAEFLGAQQAKSVLLTSASSKTAIGLAHLLSTRDGVRTIGATASTNKAFVDALGLYDSVVSYDDLADAPITGATVFVDFTNSLERLDEVYRHFANYLSATVLVGFTHPRSSFEPPTLDNPVPELFFTPAVEQQLIAEQGLANYRRRYAEAETSFLASTTAWLTVQRGNGPQAIADAYRTALAGKQPPDVAEVLIP